MQVTSKANFIEFDPVVSQEIIYKTIVDRRKTI